MIVSITPDYVTVTFEGRNNLPAAVEALMGKLDLTAPVSTMHVTDCGSNRYGVVCNRWPVIEKAK